MTKQQKEQFDNLYNLTSNIDYMQEEENEEKIKIKRSKEREKRIKKKKQEQEQINNSNFDFDIETVIGMTNKNKQSQIRQEQTKLTKKQAKIIRKKKKIKKIINIITLLIIIIGGIVFALVSPVFEISEINVINNEQVSQDTIISLSKLEEGQNIFKYNKKKVQKEIKTNAYIQSVEIKRIIPDKVEIIVKEREKKYNINSLNGYAYINNQGYILETSEQKLDLPLIQGISTEAEQIVAGNRLSTEDLEKLENVIQIINICKNYELDDKISIIDIKDKTNYILYMETEKKTIYLGDESNLSNKMLYIPAILAENQGKEGIIYLNGDVNNNFKPRFKLNVEI